MKSILFIIFNRPDTTKRVFEAIRIANPPRLYIAADAPRVGNSNDLQNCKEARATTEQVDWPCEVKRLYQTENLGCSLGPRAAFDWFFSQEAEGIILEDDCLPHPDFFVFASTMLERYRDEKSILSINGSNLGYQLNNGESYTYSRFMNMWGWATWRRSYNQIDYSLNHWRNVKNKDQFLWKHLRINLFDFDIGWIKYWRFQFDKSITTKNITWWDYQWIYNQLINQQCSVVPSNNLVQNIGFDENGSHTLFADSPAANIPTKSIQTRNMHAPLKIEPDFLYEREYVKKIWCTYIKFSRIQTIKYLLKVFLKYLSF